MNSEGHLIVCSLSRITVVGASLGSHQPWVLGQIYSTTPEFPPVEQALRPVIGYPDNVHATIVPMGVSCHSGHYCVHIRIRLS